MNIKFFFEKIKKFFVEICFCSALSTSFSSCRHCSSSFSSSSPTRCSWQTCTTPLRRVWTLLTSSPSPQVMSPRPMTSTSSRTHRSPLSFKIPAADQDMEDLTLGEMLTEAYRGQVDYFVQGGVSVSQSSSSVKFDGSGQPDGEMVDRSGQPDERNSSKAQIRTLLEEQRQTRNSHARTPSSSSRRRAPTPSRTFMATEIGIS